MKHFICSFCPLKRIPLFFPHGQSLHSLWSCISFVWLGVEKKETMKVKQKCMNAIFT